jgi:predicted deoxyguanosinetriphosphate triphosphohydrolase
MNKIEALIETSEIITNKAFQRLAEKTQVLHPENGREETVQNRLTHSYEVANTALLTAKTMDLANLKADYQYALHNVCLLHDIGHPPFGHLGSRFLNKKFKSLGLEEGFSDNNNNFIVIEKNQFKLSDYTLASIIKYPDELYDYQKEKLLKILDNAIELDIKYFEKKIKIYEKPKRTIACEIMDEADRNSYVCSDLADCFSLGIGNSEPIKKIYEENIWFTNDIKLNLISIISAIDLKDKSLIKKAFKDLRILLSTNYYIGDNLQLKVKNPELIKVRELLYEVEKDLFWNHEKLVKQNNRNIKALEKYTEMVLNGFWPSKTYRYKLERTSDEKERLRLLRDMIAETTDWYVFKKTKQFKNEEKEKNGYKLIHFLKKTN